MNALPPQNILLLAPKALSGFMTQITPLRHEKRVPIAHQKNVNHSLQNGVLKEPDFNNSVGCLSPQPLYFYSQLKHIDNYYCCTRILFTIDKKASAFCFTPSSKPLNQSDQSFSPKHPNACLEYTALTHPTAPSWKTFSCHDGPLSYSKPDAR